MDRFLCALLHIVQSLWWQLTSSENETRRMAGMEHRAHSLYAMDDAGQYAWGRGHGHVSQFIGWATAGNISCTIAYKHDHK